MPHYLYTWAFSIRIFVRRGRWAQEGASCRVLMWIHGLVTLERKLGCSFPPKTKPCACASVTCPVNFAPAHLTLSQWLKPYSKVPGGGQVRRQFPPFASASMQWANVEYFCAVQIVCDETTQYTHTHIPHVPTGRTCHFLHHYLNILLRQ